MSGILYSLIARDVNVLAEQTASGVAGNFAAITRVLLKKIPVGEDGKMNYVYDQYLFYYQVKNGLTVLCMTEKDSQCSKVTAFGFLTAAEAEFLKIYSGRWQKASAYVYNNDFKSVLGRLMVEHSIAVRDSKTVLIGEQLQEIKGIMARNIELVLDRGEKIEILVTKSEQMEEHAFKFSKRATKLKRHFCCVNAKYTILGILIVLIIIYVIMAFACGGPKLKKCF